MLLPLDTLATYCPRVRSTDLKREQLQRLVRTVTKHQHWLEALSGRCHQKRFPVDDPVKVAADDALASVQKLADALKKISSTS